MKIKHLFYILLYNNIPTIILLNPVFAKYKYTSVEYYFLMIKIDRLFIS